MAGTKEELDSKVDAPSTYVFATIEAPFEEAVTQVTEALKHEGFGVLTTIDVQATLKAKLNRREIKQEV